MSAALVIAGALLTCGACLAAGLILFQKLGLRFYRQETWALALLTGSAIYSTFVFAILAAHLAYEWVFPAASLAAIALCVQRRAHVLHAPAFPPIPLRWRVVLTAGGLAFGTFYLMHAMAPETSPDGSGYHLGLVARYLRQRGFGAITTSLYASFPMGMEMLFLNAFSTGKHSAAATTHLCFLLALTAAIVQYGRRVGNTGAGVTAGLIVFISPVFGV
ncbi:MAG TPA: hypothetical protein VEQ63_06885, partial [Bryobacteraceae bacterium]|nr:hypothetical protein [Bryobacteraceae bacterium]